MIKKRLFIALTSAVLLAASLYARRMAYNAYRTYYTDHCIRTEHGLRAYYYSNVDWKEVPVYTGIDKRIRFKGYEDLLTQLCGQYSFSIMWQGLLDIPVTGKYRFKLYSDDGTILYIDGAPILKNGGIHPAKKVVTRIHLKKGLHPFYLRYFQAKGLLTLSLFWKPPHPYSFLNGPVSAGVLIPADKTFSRRAANRLNDIRRRYGLISIILSIFFILCAFNVKTGFLERLCFSLKKAVRNNLPAAAAIIAVTFFKMLFLGSAPGIFGDEAWFPLKAAAFIDGRSINMARGMTAYTGPFFLIQAPFYILLGYNTAVMRITSIIFNSLALITAYILAKKMYNKKTGVFCILFLGLWPVNFLYTRLNYDIFTFSLFFIFLSVYLIRRGTALSLASAGIIIGAGIYNHLLFIAFPCAILFLGVIETKAKLLFDRRLYLILVPALIIWGIKYADVKISGPGRTFDPLSLKESVYIMKYASLHILPQILDGTDLYRMLTGRLLVPVIPLNLIITAAGITILLVQMQKHRDKNVLRILFVTAAAYFIIMFRIPTPKLRYFYIPAVLLSLMPALWLSKIKNRKLSYGILSLFCAVNIFYISSNFFWSFRKYRGGFFCRYDNKLTFPVYIRSHHYIDKKKLYAYLIKNGYRNIASNYYINHSLAFLDMGNKLLYCYKEKDFKGKGNEALIFYKEGIHGRLSYPEQMGMTGLEQITAVKYFRIYKKKSG